MIAGHVNHCEVVREALAGERPEDQQTLASLAILAERLEHLKKMDDMFDGVGFSADVESLRSRVEAMAII